MPEHEMESSFLPRFDFSSEELSRFAVTRFLAGDWMGLGCSEAEAAESVLALTERLHQAHIATGEIVHQVFFPLQMLLMARRHRDFATIQQEPAFSKVAQSNLLRLFDAFLSGGEKGFMAKWADIFSHSAPSNENTTNAVTLAGGTGSSMDSAIITMGVDEETTVFAEYWYLAYVYGRKGVDWNPGLQSLLEGDVGKIYDHFQIELSDGRGVEVYFDISHLAY